MAPRTRNTTKTKRVKKGRKKRVRFHKSDNSGKSQILIKPPENYENLILHYLTKLKRLFGSADEVNDNNRLMKDRQSKQNKSKNYADLNSDQPTTRKLSSKQKLYDILKSDENQMEKVIKDKAFNIVNSAIEYGFANNILEKKGNYFILKNRKNLKLAARQPTPGPNISNKSFHTGCKCHKCRSQKSVGKHDLKAVRSKTSDKLCREHTSKRPLSAGNQTYLLRSGKTPQPSQSKHSSLSLLSRKSRSRTNSKSAKDHAKNTDCRCSVCRTLKLKQKLGIKK